MKRLAVYVFYDKDGIVDEYIPYFLDDFIKNVDKLLIVCNGKLSEAGERQFERYTEDLLIRENKGYDIWGYKEGLEYFGWEQLSLYDEVVLLNDTIMGPIYPFEEMFTAMESRKVDFWGITRHYRVEENDFNCIYGYTPEHIQSYFMVFRQSMIRSSEFQNYWDNLPPICSYQEAVEKHEAIFTKYFGDLGFLWDTYVDSADFEELGINHLVVYAKELIEKKRSPIFKKNVFFQDYRWMLDYTAGQIGLELFNYLKSKTTYPTELILQSLLRTKNLTESYRNLHWNYILPKYYIMPECKKENLKLHKVAFLAHFYYADMMEEMIQYLKKLPQEIDIYLFTDSEEKISKIDRICLQEKVNYKEIKLVPNRGRDMGSLLVAAQEIIPRYEYLGFVHDKKSGHLKPATIGTGFFYKSIENMLCTTEYIYNILHTFDKNPMLGMLSPVKPNHAEFYRGIGKEWGDNYEIAYQLAKELDINELLEEGIPPIAPLGDYFWFRSKALDPLFKKKWRYEDLPQEPIGLDGTLLHAIERIYPFVVQKAGYFAGYVMNDEIAKIEYTNLDYLLGTVNNQLYMCWMQLEETNNLLKESEKQKEKIVNDYENSTCWKITLPIRWIVNLMKGKR